MNTCGLTNFRDKISYLLLKADISSFVVDFMKLRNLLVPFFFVAITGTLSPPQKCDVISYEWQVHLFLQE